MTALFDDIIDQFGRSIGIQDLALREAGALVLDMQQQGRLSFELIGERREEVSISLTRRVDFQDDRAPSRLLELCHYRAPAPFPVRCGLTRMNDLIFAVRMETHEFTLPNLHAALDWLSSLHQQSEAFVSLARN